MLCFKKTGPETENPYPFYIGYADITCQGLFVKNKVWWGLGRTCGAGVAKILVHVFFFARRRSFGYCAPKSNQVFGVLILFRNFTVS
jgi:hypothetical protein